MRKQDDDDEESSDDDCSVVKLDEPCKSHDYGIFVELFPSHFSPSYMQKKGKFYPKNCSCCSKTFVPGKKPADYKGNDLVFVTNRNPVRCCKLATETFSKCMCALCTDCFKVKELGNDDGDAKQGDKKRKGDREETASRRSKRSKSGETILLPGEKLVDGIVVAAN